MIIFDENNDLPPKNRFKLKVNILASKIGKRRKGISQENATHRNRSSIP